MLTFKKCVEDCLATPDFVQEFDRLAGCHLGAQKTQSPVDALVDQATGFDEMQKELDRRDFAALFVAFVFEVVWLRLPEGDKDPTDAVEPPSGRSFTELMRDREV